MRFSLVSGMLAGMAGGTVGGSQYGAGTNTGGTAMSAAVAELGALYDWDALLGLWRGLDAPEG